MRAHVKPVLISSLILASWHAEADGRQARLFKELALAPDGSAVATVEYDDPSVDGLEPTLMLVIHSVSGSPAVTVQLPCPAGPECKPSDITFSNDSKRVAFVLRKPGDGHAYIDDVKTDGTDLVQRLAFEGVLGQLHYGTDGTLAVLAVAGAHKEVGAIKAGAPLAGEIGVSADEQRIAIVKNGLQFVSPQNLYVYEYSWRPDGAGFVATASPGTGDNSWWIARLWSFPVSGTGHVIYTPPAKQQIASPAVSPDGKQVAFIGGIMSDFGATGGDAYVLPLDDRSKPRDVTPGLSATVTALKWDCSSSNLVATTLRGPDTQILSLSSTSARPKPLWTGPETLTEVTGSLALACKPALSAAVHETFSQPPEIEIGEIGAWHDFTHTNQGLEIPVVARSLIWKSDGLSVQGWLLQPANHANSDNQRMITIVHGGPSSASTPEYIVQRRGRWLLDAGYDVFLPNPRGSFGQGEAFTLGNVRDFGHGDLRDILAGVDAAERVAPIDPEAIGLLGYSYGGYMTMWAVTQTNRFKAAVAGAGVSDWLSYYGENGIDRWMIPFFGASVYDDPAVYAKSSPINFIKHVRTPTFEYVGDRDLECPMPQTQEFWHALTTFGVPTEFVVYPGQGHELHSAVDRADAKRRTLAWFARWLQPPS